MGKGGDRYGLVRDLAWKVLLDCGADSLPVDLKDIAKQKGVSCLTYTEGGGLVDACGLDEIRKKNDAFSVFTDRWYILYDESGSRALFAAAHELGHILLEHKMEQIKVGYFTAYYTVRNCGDEEAVNAAEWEASLFAERLLAPACALWGIGAFSGKAVAEATALPEREAEARGKRIAELAKRGQFLKSDAEKQLYKRFEPFIKSYGAGFE